MTACDTKPVTHCINTGIDVIEEIKDFNHSRLSASIGVVYNFADYDLESLILSIDNANTLFRGTITFVLEDVSVFQDKEMQSINFDDVLYGGEQRWAFKQNNEHERINIYVTKKDPRAEDNRIAFTEPFSDFMIKHGGLCYVEGMDDPNTIFMSDVSMINTNTLGHELGHYFGLGHCNCCFGPEANIDCWLNRMNIVYTNCQANELTDLQLDTVATIAEHRECVLKQFHEPGDRN